MLISLVNLPESGLSLQYQYQHAELDLTGYEFSLRQPPLVTGRIVAEGRGVRVRGQVVAELEAVCDRCLQEVSFPLQFPFDLFYTPEDELAGQSGEIELQTRDLDSAIYENDELDLDELVREQLELSLPPRILCREDCRGLCPQCGAELNHETCQCQEPIDPRWQVLADLRNKS